MRLYEIKTENKSISCDESKRYAKDFSEVRAMVKQSFLLDNTEEVTVTLTYLPSRMNRINLLNRKGFVLTKTIWSATVEQWNKGDYDKNFGKQVRD